MNLLPHIERFRKRFAEVESLLSDPKVFDNPQNAQELSREYARLKELVATGDTLLKTVAQLQENRALLKSEHAESEMALLAREEISRLEAEEKKLSLQIHFGLVPPDPTDSRNTIIEIRAGAGGSESALFAADLYRMYCRYAETRGWKVETLDSNPSDLGGFKEIRKRRASRPTCACNRGAGPHSHQHHDRRGHARGAGSGRRNQTG